MESQIAVAVLQFLTGPFVAPVLLALGVLGLLFELKAGAGGLGAIISLLGFGAFFGASVMLGLAGWQEIILLALGALALAIEAFLLPGFGAAGLLGLCLVTGATVLALLGGTATGGDVAGAFGVLGASLVLVAAVFYAWLRHLPYSDRFAGLLLRDGVHRGEGYIAAPQRDDLIGLQGVAVTDLRPSGVARVGDERIDVVTEGDYVASGAAVTVVRAEGYRHVVRPAHPVGHLPAQGATS